MLQNLNVSTIIPYGSLVPQSHVADMERLTGGRLTLSCYFSSSEKVLLAPREQMAAIQFLHSDGSCVSFYLDKPVAINPGVVFAVLPLDESCVVYFHAEQPLQKLEAAQPEPLQMLHSELTLRQIRTFFFQEHGPDFFFAGEQHSAYELVYVTQGRLHTLVGGCDYVVEQNEALIISPDLWHVQYGERDSGVSFFVTSFLSAAPLPQEMLLRVLPERWRTSELMGMLQHEYGKTSPYRDDILVSLLQSLLVRYARLTAGASEQAVQTPASSRNDNQILDKAVQYIAENVYEKITVMALAQYCSVSTAYLSVLFQRHLNISPGAYMLRTRLEESCQLIRSGVGNMAEIARQLHFSSAPHFSAAFKRQYGITPTAYAKRLL